MSSNSTTWPVTQSGHPLAVDKSSLFMKRGIVPDSESDSDATISTDITPDKLEQIYLEYQEANRPAYDHPLDGETLPGKYGSVLRSWPI